MSGISLRRRFPVLARSDIERIHGETLRVLEKVGVRVGTRRGLQLLQENGADVDMRTMVAKIPEHLIEEAIRKKGGSITLCARDPKWDAELDMKHVHITNDGNGTWAADFETGERRASTQRDLANSAIVSQPMKNLHVYWPMVSSQDVHPSIIHLVDLKVSLMNTEKHVQFATAVTTGDAVDLVRMAAIVAGGYKELRARPLISSVHTSLAPLQHDGDVMDAAFVFGEAGIPVSVFTMPIPGASGPTTLAGSLVIANAEVLSGLAVCQLANPGCPVIYGIGCANLDMKTTTRAGGGPEHGLTSAAAAEIAHYYGMPSLTGGFASTSSRPGTQAAIEKLVSGMSPFLAGSDMICGIGLLEDCRTLWLEQLPIEDEMIGLLTRISQGIQVDGETLALDVIERVGIGKSFLGQRHTMDFLMREHYIPSLIDRRSYDAWIKDGGKGMEDAARKRVKEALSDPQAKPLDADQVKAIDAIIDEARKQKKEHLSPPS